MPGKTLGLEITEKWVTAVQVKSEFKGHQITACSRVPIGESEDLETALSTLFAQMDLKSDVTFSSITEAQVSFRNLRMPFKDAKKIRQALPYEMENLVPFSVDELIVDFLLDDQTDHAEILAASINKTFLSERLARMQSQGLDPEVFEVRCMPLASRLIRQEEAPEAGLLLHLGETRGAVILFLAGRVVLIRTLPFQSPDLAGGGVERSLGDFCIGVQNTLHAFTAHRGNTVPLQKIFFTGAGALHPEAGNLLSRFLEAPAQPVDLVSDRQIHMDGAVATVWNGPLMDTALALALRDAKRDQGFNFRKGEFKIEKEYLGMLKEFRRSAVFLAVLFIFLIINLGVDYYSLKKRHQVLDDRMTEVFKDTFPEVDRIVDPLNQMKIQLKSMEESDSALPILNQNVTVVDLVREISRRIPKSLDVHVTTMVIDPETVRISGRTDTFNTVDSIKGGLEPSSYFGTVTITSANLDRSGKQVQFEIRLQRPHGALRGQAKT